MKVLIVLAFAVLMASCAMTPNHKYSSPTSYQPTSNPSYQNSDSRVVCTEVIGHEKSSGEHIPSYYRCEGFTYNSPEYTSAACGWVDGYTKKDGTQVDGHTRCTSNISRSYNHSAPSSASHSSSSNCHYVSGYRRKNGTYVRGHMRCR